MHDHAYVSDQSDKPRQIVQTGVVTEDFGSTITRVNHIDTYSCFPLGETELPDPGVELDQVASELANLGVIDSGLGFDEIHDDEITEAWINRGPWANTSGDPDFWTVDYDHKGWLKELAEASVAVLNSDVVDPGGIVRAVDLTGETWSPSYYNFTTDGYMATWTVDTDALEAWLAENNVEIGNGRGIDGFIRTADDETWYLGNAIEAYLEHEIGESYLYSMLEYLAGNGVEWEYIDVKVTDAGRAWAAEYVARRAELDKN